MLGRRQRARLRVAAQPHTSVQYGGPTVVVYHAAAAEAAVSVHPSGGGDEGWGQVLPVYEVRGDGMAPDLPCMEARAMVVGCPEGWLVGEGGTKGK